MDENEPLQDQHDFLLVRLENIEEGALLAISVTALIGNGKGCMIRRYY